MSTLEIVNQHKYHSVILTGHLDYITTTKKYHNLQAELGSTNRKEYSLWRHAIHIWLLF